MSKSQTIDVSSLPTIKQRNNKHHRKLTKQQQLTLQNMFDQSQLQNYFISAQASTPFQTVQLAGFMYTQDRLRKITHQIQSGQIDIQKTPSSLNQQFLKQKISIEEEKALNLKLKKSQIQRRLEYLDMQTNSNNKSTRKADSNPQLFQEFRPPNILSKQEHQQYIQRIIRARQQRDKRHKQIVMKLQQGIKQQQQKLKLLQKEKLNKEKQRRRKQIQKNLQKKKQQHQKILQQNKKSQQEYKKIKAKQFLHQKMEEKYESQVIMPALQQKKKKLKEIRQMSKAFDIQELKRHEKQYVQKRNQSFSVAKSKVNEDWNYKPPEKTERLSHILESQKLQQKQKLHEKKRLIDQKIQRQQHFIEYLKQRFVPRIDQNKQKQIEERKIKQKTKRRQSSLDGKTLGISYLQEVKKLKKKQPVRPETQRHSQSSMLQQEHSTKGMTDYLTLNRKDKQYYQERRRSRLQNLIKHEKSPQPQKIVKLKRQSQKIYEAYLRKEELAKLKNQDINSQDDALQLLLSGIKAKMGIINIYNNQQQHKQTL